MKRSYGFCALLGGLLISVALHADDPKKKPASAPAPARHESAPAPARHESAPAPAPRPAPAAAPAPVRQSPSGNSGGYTRPSQPSQSEAPVRRPMPAATPQQQNTRPPMQSTPQQNTRPQPGAQPGVQPNTRPSSPYNSSPYNQSTRPGAYQPQGNDRPGARPAAGPGPGSTRPAFAPRPGARVEAGPGGHQIVHAPNGGQVRMDHGRVAEVRTANGAVIRHTPDGFRHVEVVRPGGRVVVVNGRGSGYVQRSVVVSNRTYVQRTYVVRGVVVTNVYRPYAYRPGFVLNVYAPMHYYRPGFYMYAYNPWARPVIYASWGWGGSPWYGYYGGYFAPAPYYPSPAFWLADYMIAATLEQAYQERAAANAAAMSASYGPAPQGGLTPEVKREIADEVARQLRQEQAEAQSGMPANTNPFSADSPHVFIANTSVEAMAADQSCTVSEGDVLELRGAPPLDATSARVEVRASKGGCPVGAIVMVGLQELAEMQNHMRETIDRGLGDMQRKQGQGGLPAMSGEAAAPPSTIGWASEIKPDQGAQSELNLVSDEASKAEQEAVSGALESSGPSESNAPAPRRSVGLGSTIGDVVTAWGEPIRTADLGSKKIYVYKDVKVTFQDGKVVDVQ